MSRGGALVIAAIVVLGFVGLLFREDERLRSPTSFGNRSAGHLALFEVLRGLDLAPERSFEPPALAATDAPLWFIEPWRLCEADPGEGEGELEPAAPGLEAFLARGGLAVVFLSAKWRLGAPAPEECEALAGIPLPSRVHPSASGAPAEDEDGAPSIPIRTGAATRQHIESELGPSRTLELPPLSVFEAAGDWAIRARLDSAPFVLERETDPGGRIVAIADGAFLENRWIDGGDAVLLATDLVRALGPPRIDESQHDMRLPVSPVVVLARLGALPVFFGLVALGGAWTWRRAAVPSARPDASPELTPALERYTESLAALYARSRDWPQLAEHYRRLSLDRIRVHFALPADARSERLLERLRAERRAAPGDLERLASTGAVTSREDWIRCAEALDRVVEEVCR